MKKQLKNKKKVLIALSGGIDSAVSAYLLLKQGFQVEAAFMRNWSSTEGLLNNDCPWLVDWREAVRVAAFLKIPMHSLDFEKEYQENVMEYFFQEYAAGRTPNPDVMCNKEIKFKMLYNWAMENGFEFLATGHYARLANKKSVNKQIRSQLLRSVDEFKDQTYFIYNIKTEQLPHLMFPIGGMKKVQVRKLAQKIGLPNADKKESMGLCFVGKVRLKDFLEQKLKPKKGPIILFGTEQNVGQHEGLHNYTIGQRQGIKVGGGGPYYVVKKDLVTNSLFVTNNPKDPALEIKELEIHSVNWINTSCELRVKNYELSSKGFELLGRYRHQGDLIPVTIYKKKDHNYLIKFKRPQKAVASGQSLVLYKGKECVGGGVII